jgi:transcriptional regulator with XRE-family HTH domain
VTQPKPEPAKASPEPETPKRLAKRAAPKRQAPNAPEAPARTPRAPERTWHDVEVAAEKAGIDVGETPAYSAAMAADALGRIVRSARNRAGLTQDQLAKGLDTSQPGVARLERGAAVPTIETLAKVAAAVGERLVVGIIPEQAVKEQLWTQVAAGEAFVSPDMIDPMELARAEQPLGDPDILTQLYGDR